MKSTMVMAITLMVIFIVAESFKLFQTSKPWPVPDKYNKMVNPVKADANSLSTGKEVWIKHCQSCHGKSGKGDGTKAAELDTKPDDLSQSSVQSETDGAFFYKIREGREDMPSFKKKIPDDEDVWNVINYMRTLKKS